jgi:hypothetical protein
MSRTRAKTMSKPLSKTLSNLLRWFEKIAVPDNVSDNLSLGAVRTGSGQRVFGALSKKFH